MKPAFLATVAAVALSVTVPAYTASAEEPKTTGSVEKDVKRAWKDIKQDSKTVYNNFKATVINETDKTPTFKTVDISSRVTADGIIGKPVYNSKDERIATVKDIIVDKSGKATSVILADGEFPGYDGKLVAFDYGVITKLDKDGDVIVPLTEANMKNAAEFSYVDNAGGENVKALGANYSVAKLLDADLVNEAGDDIGDVDDISFRAGKANQLIVSFDKVLGLGGDKAALNYSAATVVHEDNDAKDDDLDFKMSANQAARFEAYKKSVTN